MATVTNYMEAKGFINFTGPGGGGFVENYKLNTVDYTVAKQQLAQILTARSAILPYNWLIAHATVSAKTVSGDSSIPQVDNTRPTPASGKYANGPLLLDAEADLAVDALCNDKRVCLLFRFDTGAGKQTNRIVRALRDSWVTDNTVQLSSIGGSAPFTPADTAAADASALALNNYLRYVGNLTKYMKKVPSTNPQQYDPLDWAQIQFQRVSGRDMGKGFSSRKGRRKARI